LWSCGWISYFEQPKVPKVTTTTYGRWQQVSETRFILNFYLRKHIIPRYFSILVFGISGRCPPVPWKRGGKQNNRGTLVFFLRIKTLVGSMKCKCVSKILSVAVITNFLLIQGKYYVIISFIIHINIIFVTIQIIDF